jgi:hypothetical protein
MAVLTLGNVLFRGFEIPSKLTGAIGGKQALGKHKLIGGARVTDVMGNDPDDPAWEGRFRGADAVSRAQTLDAMRAAGQEVLLTFGSIQYTVVIEEFVADYMQSYEIPYRIRCYITVVNTVAAQPSLDSLVASDNTALSGQVSQFSSNQTTLETGMASLPGNVA